MIRHPLRPLSAGALFLQFMCGSVFPHSKNIKIRSSAHLWQARTKKELLFFLLLFFFKELVRLHLLLDQCTFDWHQTWKKQNKKQTNACVFLQKADCSGLIWILNSDYGMQSVTTREPKRRPKSRKKRKEIPTEKMKSRSIIKNKTTHSALQETWGVKAV